MRVSVLAFFAWFVPLACGWSAVSPAHAALVSVSGSLSFDPRNDPRHPAVAADSDNTFIVVWTVKEAPGRFILRAARVDGNGFSVGGYTLLESPTELGPPKVAATPDGHLRVALATDPFEVHLLGFDREGKLELDIEAFPTATHLFAPFVTVSEEGYQLFGWSEDPPDFGLGYMQAMELAPDDRVIGHYFLSPWPGYGALAVAAPAPGGAWVAAWSLFESGSRNERLLSTVFPRAVGGPSGVPTRLADGPELGVRHRWADVGGYLPGGYVVVWEQYSEGSPEDAKVMATVRTLGQDSLRGPFVVGSGHRPALAMNRQGLAVVAWRQRTEDRSLEDRLMLQALDRTGRPDGPPTSAFNVPIQDCSVASGEEEECVPRLAMTASNRVLAIWDAARCGAERGHCLDAEVFAVTSDCAEDAQHLCLDRDRFRTSVEWEDFEGQRGPGTAAHARTEDSGLFWFFTPNNWELQVKVLDGCRNNGYRWVFAAATTNVGYTLTVRDVVTGKVQTYRNRVGDLATAIADTAAFPCE